MNTTIGDYMGDADHVLDRHDLCEDNNPPHYPNDWDDKQWEGVYKKHNEALKIIADNAISQSQLRERQEEKDKIEKENSLSYLLMVLEGLRNDKQEKTREAGTKQRKTMSTIAKVNSCNAKNSLKEFKESASELETIDKKAVAFLWAMLGHHLKQKSSKKAKKNITDMQVVTRDVMNRRDIPTEGAALATLLSTITHDERKAYLMLSK